MNANDARKDPPNARFAYLFAAKGIQRYILDSGPLRDLVGASDLIAGLAADPPPGTASADLIGEVLQALQLQADHDVRFSRRGGGAFCLHADDRAPLNRVRALWALAVGLRCPGLESAHAGPVAGAGDILSMDQAYRQGTAVRQNAAASLLPAGHLFTEFNRRTGRVITRIYAYKNDPVPADMLTEPQRRRAQLLQARGELDGVARRFLGEARHADGCTYVFPRNMEADQEDPKENPAFPFDGDDRRVAVIHADLSGLGQIFQNITAQAADAQTVRDISAAIEAAVEAAVRCATRAVLLPRARPWRDIPGGPVIQHIVPARPVVLGGDDITVLVRADLAVPFTNSLLEQIERKSADAFTCLRRQHPELSSLNPLSACAGIAVVNAGAPFLMAQNLAEDLCRFAKKQAKRAATQPYPSMLAFHNAQSTLQERYDDILDREMTANGVRLTANPYVVGKAASDTAAVPLARLLEVAGLLDGYPRGKGKLIEAARLLFSNSTAAEETWRRWREVLADGDGKSVLDKIDQALCYQDQPKQELTLVIGVLTDALEVGDFGTSSGAAPGAPGGHAA